MAYISFKPTDHFNTKLYTGNGSTNAITGVGLQPDFTWLKKRSGVDGHNLFDTVRGATKVIMTSSTNAEATEATKLQSWQSDGFTLGSSGVTNANTATFASWNWKAGTTSGISGGTITPSSYSINTTSKFGIYKYTGTGANATIAHGLGVKPDLIIIKSSSAAQQWNVYHSSVGATKALVLNTTAAGDTSSNFWNNTEPDASVFTIGTNGQLNTSSGTYIAYCFAGVKGFSKFGTYMGNANVDGRFIYLGFEPAMLMIKRSDGIGGWVMHDNKRPIDAQGFYNVNQNYLQAQDTGGESNNTNLALDFLSNGFKLRNSAGDTNTNGGNFIYIAWAKNPIVGNNGTAGGAR